MSPRGRPRKQPGLPATFGDLGATDDDLAADGADELTAADDALRDVVSDLPDRAARIARLTALMNSPTATGAEIVAAARLLEAMDRALAGDASQVAGPPLPTTRAEQVVRLVHLLATAAPDVRAEALELVARRSKAQAARIREMAPVLVPTLTLPTQGTPAAHPDLSPPPPAAEPARGA